MLIYIDVLLSCVSYIPSFCTCRREKVATAYIFSKWVFLIRVIDVLNGEAAPRVFAFNSDTEQGQRSINDLTESGDYVRGGMTWIDGSRAARDVAQIEEKGELARYQAKKSAGDAAVRRALPDIDSAINILEVGKGWGALKRKRKS